MTAPASDRHTVLLVDDHDLIRHGLARAFERTEDFAVVGGVGSVDEGCALAESLHPDVVVTDVRLPDGTGFDLVRRLRQERDDLGLVVLTMYAGDAPLFEALEAGASGFVLKDAPAQDVVAAARRAAAHPTSFSAPDLAEAMVRRLDPGRPRFSERETDMLRLLAEGLSVAAISQRMYVSESTAKTHLSRIYDKLGAANRAQALMAAVRSGVITEDAPGHRAGGR